MMPSKTPILDEFDAIYNELVPYVKMLLVMAVLFFGGIWVYSSISAVQVNEDYAAWLKTDEAQAEKHVICGEIMSSSKSYDTFEDCMASGIQMRVAAWMHSDYNPQNK